LSALATRGDALLDQLQSGERWALGRNYLHFVAERPIVVDVAAPIDSVLFWLADQHFRPTNRSLRNPDATWRLYRRTFARGPIGLGVNGLDRTHPAHYVVFIRPLGPRPPGEDPPLIQLDPGDADSWRMVAARPGVSAGWDVCRPFERLPEELDHAILLQPSHAQRHSTLLASGRVWKTHVVSGRQPDQVAIAFGDDPARELVWTWRTAPEVESSALRIVPAGAGAARGTAPAQPDPSSPEPRVVAGDSTCVEVPSVVNDPVIRRHHVVVGGLEPDSVYFYSLRSGTPVGWGPWQAVKTAPDRGRPTRFLYLGDAQTGLERWGRLLEQALRRHPDIDCLLMAGDLVDRGNERTNWDHFFLRAAAVFDRVPLLPCAGNHEYLDAGPRLYRAFFELPHNGPLGTDSDLVYLFECGDASVAILDSTPAVYDPAAARRQAEWLDATFARTRATWKLAMFHHPVYPSHPWRDTPALREHWVPVFDTHQVDLVLQGHDHAYLRTYPLRAHRRAEPGQGTVYVIAVSGDKYVAPARRDYGAVQSSGVSTYQTIDIDTAPPRLTYRAWTKDGRIIDQFRIEKPRKHQPECGDTRVEENGTAPARARTWDRSRHPTPGETRRPAPARAADLS
jgi:3',5'-cyclic AMP phosphodiesterase CpdA